MFKAVRNVFERGDRFSREKYRHEAVDDYYHTVYINIYISLKQFNAVVRLAIRVYLREKLFSSASGKVDSRGVGA